jgi:MFS family permease
MGYVSLLRQHTRAMAFAMGHTFTASFGQTVLVALFVPAMMEHFGFSKSAFGSLYGAATLAAAFVLPVIGWRKVSLGVTLGLMLACVILAHASHVAGLVVGLFVLRLCGQGGLTHVAQTSTARHFSAQRGKALVVTSWGSPLGEAVLPMAITSGIVWLGWQQTWLAVAGFVGVVWLPLMWWWGAAWPAPTAAASAVVGVPQSGGTAARERGDAGVRRAQTAGEVLRLPLFWCLLPMVVWPGFLLTGIFFYSMALAEARGWSAALMASSIVAFGAARFAVTLGLGPAIDRFSALRLFPVYLIPIWLGLGVLAWGEHPSTYAAFLVFAGITVGGSGSITTACWAELFGTEHLGAIRSVTGSVVVVSTAVAPPLLGAALDHGWRFVDVLPICALLMVLSWALAMAALRRYARDQAAPRAA